MSKLPSLIDSESRAVGFYLSATGLIILTLKQLTSNVFNQPVAMWVGRGGAGRDYNYDVVTALAT